MFTPVPISADGLTVPVLWDRKEDTAVNNESSEIIRMLNSEFDAIADTSIDLYPEELREEIDALNAVVYPHVNNGGLPLRLRHDPGGL